MWNRNRENIELRTRRVSLVKSGLNHVEIDKLFEQEFNEQRTSRVYETEQQTESTHRENLREKIEALINDAENQNLDIDNLVTMVDAEVSERLREFSKLMTVYEKTIIAIRKTLESQKSEYAKNYAELMTILKLQIKSYVDAEKECTKKYIQYVEATEKANEVIRLHNETLIKLNKKIAQYNRDNRRLSGR